MYDSSSWADFAAAPCRPRVGRASSATLEATDQGVPDPTDVHREARFPQYPNFVEGFPAVACADSDNPDSYVAWSAAGAASDAAFGYFGRIWTWVSSICADWPLADADRYLGPFDKLTANPVLVVGNRYDPATRYEGAADRRRRSCPTRGCSRSRAGATPRCSSRSAPTAIESTYLLTGNAPTSSTCTQDFTPFQ